MSYLQVNLSFYCNPQAKTVLQLPLAFCFCRLILFGFDSDYPCMPANRGAQQASICVFTAGLVGDQLQEILFHLPITVCNIL